LLLPKPLPAHRPSFIVIITLVIAIVIAFNITGFTGSVVVVPSTVPPAAAAALLLRHCQAQS
jgi:hypothetical protein